MANSLILDGSRTAIGKLSGSLGGLSSIELGARAISGALARSGVDPGAVDHVIMGHVLQAGQGQTSARQAAVRAGIPMSVPAMTINKVCLSGLAAIQMADLLISTGAADIVVAGGMESMTGAPYLVPRARAGLRFGDGELVDSLVRDGLFCAFDQVLMGTATERYSRSGSISRERQDELALRSHERAAKAQASGRFESEIVPVETTTREGPRLVASDEGVRPGTTASQLAQLRPAFDPEGTITAGNASQISDGAAALVLASEEASARLGAKPLAEVVAHGEVAGPDPSLLTQPSRAARRALAAASLPVDAIGLWEINEAFAAVVAASVEDLGIDDDLVNVNGGAIALGHPIGMSGARIALTLVNELAARGVEHGMAAICGGGGQGQALLVRSRSS